MLRRGVSGPGEGLGVDVDLGATNVAARLRACLGPLVRKVRSMRGESDLTLAQASLLARIDREGPTTAAKLAAVEMIRPQSAAQVIMVLQEKGFVGRTPDPDDSRRMIVAVTPAGREWVQDTRAAWNERLANVLAAEFSPAELRRLSAAIPLLERLRDVL